MDVYVFLSQEIPNHALAPEQWLAISSQQSDVPENKYQGQSRL